VKQTITVEQYNELSEEEKRRFIEWTASKGAHAVTVRSIGHLIWFLDDHHVTTLPYWNGGFITRVYSHYPGQEKDQWDIGIECPHDEKYYEQAELVDALWLAVKVVLSQSVQTEPKSEKAG
jgi:hypothetical protein